MTAKTLMIQGTGSGVGKSILTAALCRCFAQDGWRVAPFKAQNMALNSFVTEDGCEMGRAQVFQAEACGLKPHVAMNPVLLKPSGDNNSQVIVMGKVLGQRNAKDYYAGKPQFQEEVRQAFEYLQSRHDLIILEGAGSPAEINLRDQDFVNMAMAKMARAPVLIAGDIDRGGVFAWMKGTFDLLAPDEQRHVKGFLVNKFRGDLDLLKPGLDQFEAMVQRPILGVIPFDRELFVDEEDSLPFHWRRQPPAEDLLDVVIIRLPRISNFTDFTPLAVDPSVSVRYVWESHQMGNPDLIILPGTKNTLDDMAFLREQNLDLAIQDRHQSGAVVMGICGGLQMLGKTLRDDHKLESQQDTVPGLGLLECDSQLRPEKITRQITLYTQAGPIFSEGLACTGYEIHLGRTRFHKDYPRLFAEKAENSQFGWGVSDEEGSVIATYLHGFLDNDSLRSALLNHVRRKRGLPQAREMLDYAKFRVRQMDRLADLVRHSVNMKHIEQIIIKGIE